MIDLIQFEQSRNDLHAKLRCTCPHRLFLNKPELGMTHTIRLCGYDDANFFDRVNAQPQERVCKCGRRYRVQWFREGVSAEFIDPPVA